MSKTAPVITTGAEWNRFYHDPVAWPDDVYHDDTAVFVNGTQTEDLSALPPDASVEIRYGFVVYKDDSTDHLADHFRKWAKTQTVKSLVFEVPLDKLEAVKAAALAAGGTLVSE